MSELEKIAKQMVAKGKGILAADESTGTMSKRLSSVNVESTSETRLKFRETLFSAESMKNHISGVILYDETLKQKTSSGKSIPELIKSFGSIPGIKVDTGAKKLAGSSEEKITEGLDGLRERLEEYYKLGARFTKWRAIYNISEKYPSEDFEDAKIKKIHIQTKDWSSQLDIIKPKALDFKHKEVSDKNNIKLYIENNVINLGSFLSFNRTAPAMLLNSNDYKILKQDINFNLLLDVAHLKVSANSMKLDFSKELSTLLESSDYLHLSDNNGLNDENKAIKKNSNLFDLLKIVNINNKTITLEIYDDLDTIKESYELISSLKK